MSLVIRIDDEVWSWLQSQATPFVDTPNSVLRRLANLDQAAELSPTEGPPFNESRGFQRARDSQPHSEDQTERGQDVAAKRNTNMGRKLNRALGLNANHALFRESGTWYNNLERFPGVLFDSHGYLWIESKAAYDRQSKFHIGKELTIRDGIRNVPGYQASAEIPSLIQALQR